MAEPREPGMGLIVVPSSSGERQPARQGLRLVSPSMYGMYARTRGEGVHRAPLWSERASLAVRRAVCPLATSDCPDVAVGVPAPIGTRMIMHHARRTKMV